MVDIQSSSPGASLRNTSSTESTTGVQRGGSSQPTTLDPLNIGAIEEQFNSVYGEAPMPFMPHTFTPEPIPQEILDMLDYQQDTNMRYLNNMFTFTDNFLNRVAREQTAALKATQDLLGSETATTLARAGAGNERAQQQTSKQVSDFYDELLNKSRLNLELERAQQQNKATTKASGDILNLEALREGADIDQENLAFRSLADSQKTALDAKLQSLKAQTGLDILGSQLSTDRQIQNLQAQQELERQKAEKKNAFGGLLGTVLGALPGLGLFK